MLDNNARRVAKFGKVSKEQFVKDWLATFNNTEDDAIRVYDDIKLPVRGTKYSAGYDFFAPCHITLAPGETVKIPTGIRVEMLPEYFLAVFPRSSLGTKYRTIPLNLVPIVDADYFYSDNEGHIFIVLGNDGEKNVIIEQGKGFCQGIFIPYYLTIDDDVNIVRNGGFGSSGV